MNVYLITQETYYETFISVVAANDIQHAASFIKKRHPDFERDYIHAVLPVTYTDKPGILYDSSYYPDEYEDDDIEGEEDASTRC